jgi:hypothetical protein
MKIMFGWKAVFFATILATTFAPLANAQCVSATPYKRSALMLRQPFSMGLFNSVAFAPVASAADQDSQGSDNDPIVGFWKVNLISMGNDGIPDGTVLDSGFSQWHSDGTEILNSSRPPAIQSFCLGVWKKTGPSAYKLNHFAISWNPDGTLLGPGNIRETVALSHDHDSFVGSFTLDQYNTAGNLQVHLVGRLEGKRITVGTPVTDVL